MRECSLCHDLPSPDAHGADEWTDVVTRMRGNTLMMDVPPFSEEEAQRLSDYLSALAEG